MLSSVNSVSVSAENGNEGGNGRTDCPLTGCKRAYRDASSLQNHIKEHEIPAESVSGKVLLCSTVGCSASFPSMQKLMEHTRIHHKPNIYFQCESCRTKLRSYRNLLGHLHTCSKVPRGKPKAAEMIPPQPMTLNPNPGMVKPAEQPSPQLEYLSSPQLTSFESTTPDRCVPAVAFQPGSTDPPMLDPPVLPLQEISSLKPPPAPLSDTSSPVQSESYSLPPTLNPVTPKAAVDSSDFQSQVQTQTWTSETTHPVSLPALSSHGSPAVWRKSQGVGCSRRVLWEHTRGRYTCVQCGHRATNRKEMSEHISNFHSGSKTAENRTTPPVLQAVSVPAPHKSSGEAVSSDALK